VAEKCECGLDLPPLTWQSEEHTCPGCGKEYFATTKTVEVFTWAEFGTGDGTFPLASTERSLIDYFTKEPADGG
jgi:hypothetical protein